MTVVYETKCMPANLPEMVDEIADRFKEIYGPVSSRYYRRNAAAVLNANLAHPAIRVWVAERSAEVAGFLMGASQEDEVEIAFMHVLRAHLGHGVETQLVDAALRAFQAAGAHRIVSDWVPMCALDLHDAFSERGFTVIPRRLMQYPILASAAPVEPISLPLEKMQWAEAAECMVDAYAGQECSRLHSEIQSIVRAVEYLERVTRHSYGLVREGYCRAVWRGHRCAGVILGTEITPDTGFVLQVAVDPSFRRQGIATGMLRDLSGVFRDRSLSQMTLGVTLSNPAYPLYEKFGFQSLIETEAYLWLKGEDAR